MIFISSSSPQEGLVGSVCRASDFGSKGLGSEGPGVCPASFIFGKIIYLALPRCRWEPASLGKITATEWHPVLWREPPVCQTSQKLEIGSDLMSLMARKDKLSFKYVICLHRRRIYGKLCKSGCWRFVLIEWKYLFYVQNPTDGNNRLKRWIMIGDHHQLPPVIKNMAFQKYSNMEQSLFTRFVRLGIPTVDLDAQGRARARYVYCQFIS